MVKWKSLKNDLKKLSLNKDKTRKEKEEEAFKLGLYHALSAFETLDKHGKFKYKRDKEAKSFLKKVRGED